MTHMLTLENFGVERFENTLANGARIVLFQKTGSPIYIKASFRLGSFFDKKGREGSAHFLEHLISNGRKNFTSKDLLAEYIESIGGTFSASTTNELLSVDVQIADKNDIEHAVTVLDSIICKPYFTESDTEKERRIILAELNRYLSDQNMVTAQTVISKAFLGTAFEHPVIGTADSLNTITHQDLLLARDENLVASNLTLTVCGDISMAELSAGLGTLTIESGPGTSEREKLGVLSGLGREYRTPFFSDQNYIFLGYPGGQEYTKESACMKLIMQIMAGGRNSRLVKQLRYEKGLIYGASPKRYVLSNQSISGIMVPVATEHTEEVLMLLKENFLTLQKEGVTAEELNFVKNKRSKSQKIIMQTSQSWVDFHFRGESLEKGQYQKLDEFINEIESILLSDIMNTIDKYMKLENQIIVISGN